VLWIKAALQDQNAELRVGWNNREKKPAPDRRVAIAGHDYVVVIRLTGEKEAQFVTAFIADQDGLEKIRTNPRWT